MTISTLPTSKKHIPGPRVMPLVGWRGNYFQFVLDPTGYFKGLYDKYGALCGFVTFEQDREGTLCIFGPKEIQLVMSNPGVFHNTVMSLPAPENSALWWLGRGLNTMNGDQHKQQRHLIIPAFHKKRIESYAEEIVQITQRQLASWKIGESRNLFEEMFRLTQDISIRLLFGMDTPADVEGMRQLFMDWLGLNTLADFVPFNHPALPYGRLLRLSEKMRATMLTIIQRKRAAAGDGNDMLSMLIYAQHDDGSTLSDDEIVAEISVLWNGTHETTASSLTWTLFLLMQNPGIMSALMDEIDNHLHGNLPDAESANQLPLLDRVVKESMRLFPPDGVIPRISVAPFDIGDFHLPAGTKAMISPYVTHRLAAIYNEPNAFLPDRWLTINPSPYEYLALGGGVHYCIGAPLALLEMKIILPMLLQRFRLSLKAGLRVDRDERSALKPKNGLPVTIHPPDRQFTKVQIVGNVHEMVVL